MWPVLSLSLNKQSHAETQFHVVELPYGYLWLFALKSFAAKSKHLIGVVSLQLKSCTAGNWTYIITPDTTTR